MKRWLTTFVVTMACMCWTATLHAQSVCVSCDRPSASYRCVLKLPDGVQAPSRGRKLLQLACIEDIAKRYGHESCRVRRGAVGPCIGDEHVLSVDGQPQPQDAAGREASPPQPAQEDTREGTPQERGAPAPVRSGDAETPSPTKEKGPPKTVVEMAEQAGKDSERQIKKASKAVEGAMQKTWRCLKSLFTDC